MPSIGQENLETVMIDFFGALRRGDFDTAAGLLDPDVSWQGLRSDHHRRDRRRREFPPLATSISSPITRASSAVKMSPV
jgi:ketosteroid isomerase-like protein